MKLGQNIALIACATSLLLSGSALAQNTPKRSKTYEDSNKRLKVQRPGGSALEQLGYVIREGVIISPAVRAETGYDTNPDNLWVEQDSAYGLIDGSAVLGFVKPNQALTLAVKGKFVEFVDLETSERWDAGARLEFYKKYENGLEISANAHHLHDAFSFTTNEATAGSAGMQYQNEFLEAYSRGLVHQVRYLSQEPIPSTVSAADRPYFLNTEDNLMRTEKTAGLLIYRNKRLSPYVEGGYASINYIDQKIAEINKDAREFWGIAGVRVTMAPQLRADIGYRFSKRNLDDGQVPSYDTEYIDAKVTWSPIPNFRAIFEVDRVLREPIGLKARLSEVTTHSLLLQYQPTPRTLLSMRALQARTKDIGQAGEFRERIYVGEATYDLNNKSILYLNTQWRQMKEHVFQDDFDRIKVGLGMRVKYSGAESLPWGNIRDELKALPIERKVVGVEVDYNYLILPEMRMTVITDPFRDDSIGVVVDHDGHMDGAKYTLSMDEMTIPNKLGETELRLGVKAFYGKYRSRDISTCNYALDFDCAFFNITDVNPNNDNNTGPFAALLTRTTRTVNHWGASVEAPLKRLMPVASAKDSKNVIVPTNWKIGFALKAIEQDTDLFSIDTSVPDPVDYKENLDTYYYGFYAAYSKSYNIREGWHLDLTAEGGIYFAESDYEGNYLAYFPVGGTQYAIDRGQAQDHLETQAFIGSLKLDLTREASWGTFTLSGQAEYFSYAPEMKYNNNDEAGGGNFDIDGFRNGTKIGYGEAYSLSVGGRINVPLSKILR